MSKIFFKQPAALDRDVYRKKRLKPSPNGYAFAKSTNAVPLTIMEMGVACSEYPVVFALDADGTGTPLALLGVRDNENLFVDADGKWNAHYVPAFVNCYPFALHVAPDGNGAMVVLDHEYDGLNEEEGNPLFNEEGNPSPYLQQTISGLEQLYGQEQTTKNFVGMLNKHGLLVSRTLEVNGPNNMKIQLDGFHVIDESQIAKLSDAVLLDLTRSGSLGFVYAHILSLAMLSRLVQRLEPRLLTKAA